MVCVLNSCFALQDCNVNVYKLCKGHFKWGGKNFTKNAENIGLSLEGPDSVPMLHAGLRNSRGQLVDAKVNLSEHIGNRDASFLVDLEFRLQS